jgi:hypothetical protein
MSITRWHSQQSDLYDTSPVAESLMIWAGLAEHVGKDSKNYYEFIRGVWKEWAFPTQTKHLDFESFWAEAVHNSTDNTDPIAAEAMPFNGNLKCCRKGNFL